MSLFAIQLVVWLLSGILWAKIDVNYSVGRRPPESEMAIGALLFAGASNVAAYGAYRALGWNFDFIDLRKAAEDYAITTTIVDELMMASFLSIALGIMWVGCKNRKLFPRVLQWARVTRKYGNEDVWEAIMHSPERQDLFVHVRDYEGGRCYAGYVKKFSDFGDVRELLLQNAIVHTFLEGETQVQPVGQLYLSRPASNMTIEFPEPVAKENPHGERQITEPRWRRWIAFRKGRRLQEGSRGLSTPSPSGAQPCAQEEVARPTGRKNAKAARRKSSRSGGSAPRSRAGRPARKSGTRPPLDRRPA